MNDASPNTSNQTSNVNGGLNSHHDDAPQPNPTAIRSVLTDSLEHKKRTQRDQKLKFLDHIIRNVDILIYCELSILYYMDCSMIKFLIRALPHWFYFTPKPDIIPPTPLGQRPYISVLFGTNALCSLLHLLFSPPAAGEATRGYLHGGLMIDFVGQISPVSGWRLLGLDVLCLTLQILMLGLTLEKQRILGIATPEASGTRTGPATTQDVDAEEAGFLRSDLGTTENIEMQTLRMHPEVHTHGEERGQRTAAVGSEEEGEGEDSLDKFYTGEHVVANLHILEIIRTQWRTRSVNIERTAATGVQTAATIAGRRFTLSFGGRGGNVPQS